MRRRGRDVADDALSDLQLRFVRWCYGESPLTAPTLRPIAFTIAERASKAAIRRKGPATTQVDHEVIATEDDVLERLASDSAVAALLAGLGARDRRIIEARLADVPDDELAAELAIEPNALYVARFRALARVRSLIETTP